MPPACGVVKENDGGVTNFLLTRERAPTPRILPPLGESGAPCAACVADGGCGGEAPPIGEARCARLAAFPRKRGKSLWLLLRRDQLRRPSVRAFLEVDGLQVADAFLGDVVAGHVRAFGLHLVHVD